MHTEIDKDRLYSSGRIIQRYEGRESTSDRALLDDRTWRRVGVFSRYTAGVLHSAASLLWCTTVSARESAYCGRSGRQSRVPPRSYRSVFSVHDLFSAEWLQHVLGKDVEQILGPAEVNYADDTSFRCNGRQPARPISASDAIAYRALASALDSKEIEDSGFSAEMFPAFGAFSEDILCAAASYTVWEPSIAHIIVATHPDYRRRGFASAAISALAADAFDRGLILQWRAISSNKNSLALARHLGFAHYCSTLFVRLRESKERIQTDQTVQMTSGFDPTASNT